MHLEHTGRPRLHPLMRRKIRDKRERHKLQCDRALAAFDAWWSEQTTAVAV